MSAERSVILFGSSLYTHTLTDRSGSMEGLLEERLGQLMPQYSWRCGGTRLFMNEKAVSRALAHVRSARPDVVVFDLPAYQYLHGAASIRVKKRWPAFYWAFSAAMEGLKAMGGSRLNGTDGPRGALFRLPRDLARRLIGSEVEQPVEVSLDLAHNILDALLRIEETVLICSMPKFFWSEPDAEWCRQQTRVAEVDLRAYCEQRHIPVFDLLRSLEARGASPGLAPDGIHLDTETNRFEAALIADAVREALA
jgi:hypothetical protein